MRPLIGNAGPSGSQSASLTSAKPKEANCQDQPCDEPCMRQTLSTTVNQHNKKQHKCRSYLSDVVQNPRRQHIR